MVASKYFILALCPLKGWLFLLTKIVYYQMVNSLKNQRITGFLLATEGIGVVFVAVFLAAYLFALPSDGVLHAEPIFNLLLKIFGGAFILAILIGVILLSRKN